MLSAIRDDILPELLNAVPDQPSKEELEANKCLSRFMILFDRKGYSPNFFVEMWKQRIACCTYRKYVKDKWSESEFFPVKVNLNNREPTEIKLAERGTFLSGKIWIREIRKLTKSGHQTSIITTNFTLETSKLAVSMFSRWCQENFFKY